MARQILLGLLYVLVTIKVVLYKKLLDLVWVCCVQLHKDVINVILSIIRTCTRTTIFLDDSSLRIHLVHAFINDNEYIELVLFLYVRYMLYGVILFDELEKFCRVLTHSSNINVVLTCTTSQNDAMIAFLNLTQDKPIQICHAKIYPEKQVKFINHPKMFNCVNLSITEEPELSL